MTKTSTHTAALALSVLVTSGTVAAADGLASKQFTDGQRLAQAYELTHMAVQRVEVVGHPAYQRVVIVGRRTA